MHLTTTDPAAHLTDTLHGSVPGLAVSRIDPAEATRSYREHVMATKGKNLDDAGRATLAEDQIEIGLFGPGRQSGRGRGALGIDDHNRRFEHCRKADSFGHERESTA